MCSFTVNQTKILCVILSNFLNFLNNERITLVKKSLLSIGMIGLTAVSLLSGCIKDNDDETKKQLAQLQAQLEAEKAEKAQREAKERAEQERRAQEEREAQLYEQAKEDAKAELEEKLAMKKAEQKQKEASQQPTATSQASFTQKVVRYPATVVTQSGYGELSLRGEPSSKGLKVGGVYDGDEVTVVARTTRCEVIGNVEGCWVKVQLDNVQGYMFDGYLNREVLSQREKAKLQGNSQTAEEEY